MVGRRFLHPDLGIQLKFPEEWVITNTPASLNARLRQKKVFFQLQLKELQKRQTPTELLHAVFPKRHTRVILTGEQAGMPFVHAEIMMSAPHVSEAKIDARVFIRQRQAFVMLMWSPRSEFINYMADFSDIARSFSRYSGESEGDIPRITLHRWKHGDSWDKLARMHNHILGRFTADKLAALNGMDVNEQPHVGEIIKTVH